VPKVERSESLDTVEHGARIGVDGRGLIETTTFVAKHSADSLSPDFNNALAPQSNPLAKSTR
jgi:hypothetical protein